MSISIHVPRAGYDGDIRRGQALAHHFYPRTPCGVRRNPPILKFHFGIFLSTYPVRGTTADVAGFVRGEGISIHVPRAGYDGRAGILRGRQRHFYPRTPCGVRQLNRGRGGPKGCISIHVPRAGYDMPVCVLPLCPLLFLSTYPVRGTTRRWLARLQWSKYFYPRTPCGVRRP